MERDGPLSAPYKELDRASASGTAFSFRGRMLAARFWQVTEPARSP
jgi:hypothetical protein